jgi:HEAT repeat protein
MESSSNVIRHRQRFIRASGFIAEACTVLVIALASLAIGCRPSAAPVSPPAPTPAATETAAPAESTDKPPEVAEPAPRASAQTSPMPGTVAPQAPAPAPVDAATQLRDLAKRLIEADGRGGWRTAAEPAAELEKLGPAGGELLFSLLKDPDVAVRRGAAFHLLGKFDPGREEHAEAFASLLDDDDRTIRGIGLAAVKQMRSADQVAAVPRLATMLDSHREAQPDNRAGIARLLGSLKAEAAPALEQLATAASGDPDPRVRSACLRALGQIAGEDQRASLLAKGLADKDAAVRLVAAAQLRDQGFAALSASPDLAGALSDSDQRVSAAAAEALIRLGLAPPVQETVIGAEGKVETLTRTGEKAIEALRGVLSSKDVEARKLALACLAKIGPPAKLAVPAIENCKADSDSQIKQLAEVALQRIGAPAGERGSSPR